MSYGPYLYEAKFKSATAYEKGIVDKINGEPIEGKMFDKQLGRVIDRIKEHPHAPSSLTPAYHTGKMKASASPLWIKHGGIGKQDYITDLVLGGERVSLKVGKSQLFARPKEDTGALLYSVIEYEGYDKGLADEMGNLLDDFIDGALTQAQSREYKTISKAKKEVKELMNADAFHQKARVLVQNFFNANPKLKEDIVQEALTGDIKFDGGKPSADFLLATDKSGKKVSYNSLYYKPYVQKIAGQVKPNITFTSTLLGRKYTTKVRTYQTVFRLAAESLDECFAHAEGEVLNENIFADAWEKLKQFVVRIVEFVKAQFHKGVEYILTFLEGSLDLSMKGEVDFL